MRWEISASSMNPTYGYRRVTALVNRLLAAVGKPSADHKRVFFACWKSTR
jgi:hypothetical protein